MNTKCPQHDFQNELHHLQRKRCQSGEEARALHAVRKPKQLRWATMPQAQAFPQVREFDPCRSLAGRGPESFRYCFASRCHQWGRETPGPLRYSSNKTRASIHLPRLNLPTRSESWQYTSELPSFLLACLRGVWALERVLVRGPTPQRFTACPGNVAPSGDERSGNVPIFLSPGLWEGEVIVPISLSLSLPHPLSLSLAHSLTLSLSVSRAPSKYNPSGRVDRSE